MKYDAESDMDVYVCMKFSGAEEVAVRLSESEYVHNVYLVNNLDYDSLPSGARKKKIIADLLRPGKVVQECVKGDFRINDLHYSYIISSGYLNFNILFNNYFAKKGAKAFFVDDGVESYLEKNTADHYSAVYKLFGRFTGNGGINLKPQKLFVYAPNLVLGKQRYEEVLPLVPLDQLKQEIKKELNRIFDYQDLRLNYHVMLFDQLGTGDFRNNNLLDIQNQILRLMTQILEEDEIAIKLHPRVTESIYPVEIEAFKTSVPWEVFALNEEIEDKVFMSISSTACLTPKLIFNKEPVIIFLYNLYPIKDYDEMKDYICRAAASYNCPDRVYIPESLADLENILKKIKE